MNVTIIIDFLIRRAARSKWSSLNPVLKPGQFGYEKDTGLIKIGDGHTEWNNLPYVAAKNNMTAVTDPPETDTGGYSPGSCWFNHTKGILWVCKSVNGASTVWTKMTSGYGN